MSQPALASPEPLRSVFTSNLPAILDHFGVSLAISTYQAGKVILARNDGGTINTHFRDFQKPMGIAVDGQRLTVGGQNTIWYYRNMPAVAPKLEPPGKHDACYLPRQIHVTGDVDIHELAWGREGLWIVNTRFCCLCTVDPDHSFNPRWRPPFISALAPEDRCHLNGLALLEGRPKWVTALGETDTPAGWRANKRSGGILMDVESNQVLLRGLAMPHSPRLYAGRLWLLESGQGGLAWADLPNHTWHTVATLPGFTRGMDCVGPLAFIGLSQVRETAVFSGIPLVERQPERNCGVWVVNIQTGETVAFLRFESGVQEIFGVQLVPARFPEMLEFSDDFINHSYVLPDEAMAAVPAPLQATATPSAGAAAPGTMAAEFQAGVALLQEDRFAEAILRLEQARHLAPESAPVHNNLGNAYFGLNRLVEAVHSYEAAIARQPDLSDAHMNLGMALLKLGDLRRGFPEFDWRWQTGQMTPFLPPQPRWDGKAPTTSSSTRTLLVHTEQGAGDAIQFMRFLPQIKALGWRILLIAPEPLQPLFAIAPGVDEIRGAGDIPADSFDAYIPLLSLATVLGMTLETIPQDVPYLRVPDDRKVLLEEGSALPLAESDRPASAFRPPTSVFRPPLRVGIAWAGSPTQGNDRNRSATLAAFAPILAVPDVTFYSLQVGPKAAELAAWRGPTPIHDLGPQIKDWGDTAAAISQLDLVISVDTGVVHLAGALGKPVWVLLCYAPDWRWLLDRADSPWYPTARLFRQQQPKEWGAVMEEVAAALRVERGP